MTDTEPRGTGLALMDYPTTGRYLSVSRSTIKALAAAGHLTRVTIGSRTLFTKKSIDAYIERLQAVNREKPA
jgi:excisionase family DNA binding protein